MATNNLSDHTNVGIYVVTSMEIIRVVYMVVSLAIINGFQKIHWTYLPNSYQFAIYGQKKRKFENTYFGGNLGGNVCNRL